MIYPDENGVMIMGKGFIANALKEVDLPKGIYFFDSPSSNVLFDENLDYCMEKTVFDFMKVLQYARDHKRYLVYPSSATVYNKNTSYARCKAALEEIAEAYNIKSLGLRIAAGYGPGEAHKGKHASVVYQWCKAMLRGERPIIFGDGTQTRDFIYETDIAKNISALANNKATGIYDIGTGHNSSFNEIVFLINQTIGTNIKPIYVDRPKQYVLETKVETCPCEVTLEQGIRNIVFGPNPIDTY